ncbi:MAG: Crp/Fnr family transcriptional regulator [Myxococcota bacterium]
MSDALLGVIRHLAGTPPSRDFLDLFRPLSLDRGDVFEPAGEPATRIAFIESGLLRMFYTRADGRAFNKSFVAELDFCAALESLLDGRPSRLSIEALEPSRLLVARYADFRALYDVDPYWERLGRLFIERLYLKKARKEAAFLLDSAAERYETFLREYPALEARVPDYHVASYLGVTPESLSRLRKARAQR